MNPALQRLLDANDGVVAWAAACDAVSSDVVTWASRSGAVCRPYRRVIADPVRWSEEPPEIMRWRAALIAAGPLAALSHTTALRVWRLPVPPEPSAHVITGSTRQVRVRGIVAHRRRGFRPEAPHTRIRDGVRVTALETALVDAWPMLTADEQRAPLIAAIGERMTTPARVRSAVPGNLPQRQDLVSLLTLLDAGCRSPLEIWGYEHVFTGPGFERLRWQVPLWAGERRYWLDAFDESSATNFELDGAKYHDGYGHRTRDVKRDADLAEIGIHAVRFTHDRLTHEVSEVRQQALAIMAVRRAEGRGALVTSAR